MLEIYHPEQWHDFFLTIGTSAAVLTGLLFVSMSLHLNEVAKDYVLRHRALSILLGLTAVFMRCALVLMGGQNHITVGFELLIPCLVVVVVGIRSYIQVLRHSEHIPSSTHQRTFGFIICYLIEIMGAIILISGFISGLYIAAIAMVLNFYYTISGSWLLLVGITYCKVDKNVDS